LVDLIHQGSGVNAKERVSLGGAFLRGSFYKCAAIRDAFQRFQMNRERCGFCRCERATVEDPVGVTGAAPMARNVARLICSSSDGDFSRSRSVTVLFTLVTVSAAPAAPLTGRVATVNVNPPAHEAHARSSNCFCSTVLVVYGSIPISSAICPFFIRVTDRVLHPVAIADVSAASVSDVLDRLFRTSQKFHDPFRNIGNRLRWIPGDVLGGVKRAFGRSKQAIS
jgi:hypothetical protein